MHTDQETPTLPPTNRRYPAARLDAGIVIVITIVVATLWWILWVGPNDVKTRAIMDCMGADTSEASYDRCVEDLRRRSR